MGDPMELPRNALPEVAGFQAFLSGRIWGFANILGACTSAAETVVSLEVIEHCPSARDFMRAFHSVLAPGGLGLISTPYHGHLKNLVLIASGCFDLHFDPLCVFRRS